MADGDRIFLDENAVIYGSIVGENVRNVKICGSGVIDTGCYERFAVSRQDRNSKCLSNLAFFACQDITVDGPVLVDAADRCIMAIDCDQVVFDNVKAVGQWRYNAEGFDIGSSRNVTVRN